jgi:hypothetical protein
VRRIQPACSRTAELPASTRSRGNPPTDLSWCAGPPTCPQYGGVPLGAWSQQQLVVRRSAVLASGCCVVVWWSACPPVAHSYPSSQSRPAGGIFHPWRVTSRQPAHNPPAARRPTGSSGAGQESGVLRELAVGTWSYYGARAGPVRVGGNDWGLDGVLAGVGGAGAGCCGRGGDAVGAGREWAVLLPAGSRAISGCACRGVFGRAHRRDGYGRWGRSGVDGVGYACGLQAGDG